MPVLFESAKELCAFVRPKKRFGQHFLISPYYAARIVESIPAKEDEPVLEIGPGRGALSTLLCERFKSVFLVEKDRDLIDSLTEKCGGGRCVIVNDDVLNFEYATAGIPFHVVGNLPYSAGAMIIKKTLMHGGDILSATFMVQREVCRRIVASEGGKQRGFLSVFCQYFGTPKLLFHVPPGAFFPKPSVDSSVFQLVLQAEKYVRIGREQWDDFFSFVSTGFSMRRKKLINVLKRAHNYTIDNDVFYELDLDPAVRGEMLSVDEWIRIFNRLCNDRQ
jgi:16S rRNA (adenine1518-N6/adenine1519-N6)-dimethyltransferase